jgi:hypothetical protein
MRIAKNRIKKVRLEYKEKIQLKLELDELEKQVEGYHEHWMLELLAIRAQTGARGMLAKKFVYFLYL